MIIKDNNLIISEPIEKRLIYRALNDLRINDNNCIKYYKILDQLIYELKHHLYKKNISRFLL